MKVLSCAAGASMNTRSDEVAGGALGNRLHASSAIALVAVPESLQWEHPNFTVRDASVVGGIPLPDM